MVVHKGRQIFIVGGKDYTGATGTTAINNTLVRVLSMTTTYCTSTNIPDHTGSHNSSAVKYEFRLFRGMLFSFFCSFSNDLLKYPKLLHYLAPGNLRSLDLTIEP